MALSSENNTAKIASPSAQQLVPVVSNVRELLDTDPHAELFFETPPPDVVSSINECFQKFTNTSKKRKDSSVNKPSSDSDSGESLFITQSVTKAAQTERRLISPKTISDDSGYERERVTRRLLENRDNENDESIGGLDVSCPKRSKREIYVPPKKANFPFLLKSLKQQHLPLDKGQILENAEIGGFFKCIKQIEESYESIYTGRTISPNMLGSALSDEGDEDNSDHEVTIVDRGIFVPHYSKEQRQQWLPQSILERRNQESLRKKKTNSIKAIANKNQSKKKTQKIKEKSKKRIPKSKSGARTSCVSFTEEQKKRQETHEVLASCSEAEDSAQISPCVENNRAVIEETQRNSVEDAIETAAHVAHEDEMSPRPDHDLPNQSNFVLPPQGGGISIQNEIQHTDSDSHSVDLFGPLDSPENKNNQNYETITPNMDDDQDSDVTQIEMEGQFTSTFGTDAQRWSDFDEDSNSNSNINQIETEEQSVSVLETRTPNKFTTQDIDGTQFQKMVQSPMSRSNTEVIGVEEALNVQPSSKHLPLSDEPLKEVSSSSLEGVIKGRQKAMVEMEIDTQDSPLFKNTGLSFLKRKRKRKAKTAATDLIQSDTNILGVSDSQADVVTGLKTTLGKDRELCEVENRTINQERLEISVLPTEEALVDNGEIRKVKKKKYKLKECVNVEPCEESQSIEMAQFSDAQMPELTTKGAKKKKKGKRTRTTCVEENSTNIPSNETFDSDMLAELRANEVNKSSEAPEAGQHRHNQILEEITECLLPNEVKLAKKKRKKKRHETDESQHKSVDLDVNSVSQFDASFRVIKQQDKQVIVERKINDCVNEHLECESVRSTHRKKSNNTSFLVDDWTGLKKQRSGLQSDNTPKTSSLGSDGVVIMKEKHKKKKIMQNDTELASEIDNNNRLFESETDLLSRARKKKRTNKDDERTIVTSLDEPLGQTDDRLPEMRGNNTETDQLNHLQTSEELARCSSPSLTGLSTGKKKQKKKKRNRSEEHQHESVDLNQSLVSHFNDVTGLRATDQVTTQKITEERENDDSQEECLGGNATPVLKFGKRKKKRQHVSSPSQVDEITGVDSGLEPGSTTELEDKMNSSALSDSVYSGKQKKKKRKLKEREKEPAADSHTVHNLHSVESDHESQTTEVIPKRTKKKKKDKERTKLACIEENNATDLQLKEMFEAPPFNPPEQTQMELAQCSSPNATKLKSTKKKKKRKRNKIKEPQYESVDLDVSSVSQVDGSTTQESFEERPSDVTEHTKRKKKRTSFSINKDHYSSGLQLEETLKPEKRIKKKKQNSDCVTSVDDELTVQRPDCSTLFEKPQSPILKSPDRISKKLKGRTEKEINESTSHFLGKTAELEAIKTKKKNSIIKYNNADGQVSSLPDSEVSACIKKKKKKTDA